jgi:Holliday junction resolvase
MPGVPDVLACDEQGRFHFIELKATKGNAVDLRPHQVAWLSNYGYASVWVLVRKAATKTQPQKIYLYHGSSAMDLKMEGLSVDPVYYAEGDFDWEAILSLISPIQ